MWFLVMYAKRLDTGVECVSKRSHSAICAEVFVNLPTGCGKSLIYQALSFVCNSILKAAGH